jgi:hypothetical protein
MRTRTPCSASTSRGVGSTSCPRRATQRASSGPKRASASCARFSACVARRARTWGLRSRLMRRLHAGGGARRPKIGRGARSGSGYGGCATLGCCRTLSSRSYSAGLLTDWWGLYSGSSTAGSHGQPTGVAAPIFNEALCSWSYAHFRRAAPRYGGELSTASPNEGTRSVWLGILPSVCSHLPLDRQLSGECRLMNLPTWRAVAYAADGRRTKIPSAATVPNPAA